MQTINFPVDAVFLWVDGSDPVWLAKKKALHRQIFGETKESDATQQARFRDNGELRYALRSLEQYAPWINRVHIITDDQIPPWINTSRVNIVYHRDIFPTDALLPVFNTRPIAFCAHRIPGLAEHFLMFEDDFMLGRSVTKQDFFTKDGRPIIWMAKRSNKRIELMLSKKHNTSHDAVIANSHRVIRNHFGSSYPGTTRHYPKSMTRHTVEQLWKIFPDLIDRTLKSPFRSFDDGIITTLYPLYMISSRNGELKKINGLSQIIAFFTGGILHVGGSLGDENLSHKIRLIRLLKPRTFCINDAQKATMQDKNLFINFLQKLFPNPSKFETNKFIQL
jgi:hypothetical protein